MTINALKFFTPFLLSLQHSGMSRHCFILYNAVRLHTIVKNDRIPTGTTVNTKIS
jgi:hypothetical protein